jgi:hypothetical protein
MLDEVLENLDKVNAFTGNWLLSEDSLRICRGPNTVNAFTKTWLLSGNRPSTLSHLTVLEEVLELLDSVSASNENWLQVKLAMNTSKRVTVS